MNDNGFDFGSFRNEIENLKKEGFIACEEEEFEEEEIFDGGDIDED